MQRVYLLMLDICNLTLLSTLEAHSSLLFFNLISFQSVIWTPGAFFEAGWAGLDDFLSFDGLMHSPAGITTESRDACAQG